LTEDFKTWR